MLFGTLTAPTHKQSVFFVLLILLICLVFWNVQDVNLENVEGSWEILLRGALPLFGAWDAAFAAKTVSVLGAAVSIWPLFIRKTSVS